MESPRSLPAARAAAPVADILTAARRIDGVSWIAIVVIFVGWFFVDTLVASVGSLQHGVRFFDISSAIADPTRIFFTADAPWRRVLFVLLCLLCLLAPMLPHWRAARWAWAAYLAPLALMVACGALLYSQTSSEFFATAQDAQSLAGNAIRFANNLVHRGSGVVARHVSIGAGGYLAFAGSLTLAVQGMRRLIRDAP
jgi:hypothetical protein